MERYDEHDMMKEALDMARPSRTPWVLFVLALVAGGAVAFMLLRKLDGARTETAAASARMLDAEEKLAAERAARAELDQQRERLEAERRELLQLKEELSKSVAQKDEEIQKLKGTFDELQEKMKAEIAKGEILLSEVAGRLKVDLVDKVLFDSGEAQISKRGEEVLSRVGAVLARIDDKLIQVSGHTDDSPISSRLVERYPSNWELSTARATNVVRFLQEKAGVPAKRLVASGYGEFHPVASNAKPASRARNRRIEILLTPALDVEKAKVETAPAAKAAPAKASAKKTAVASAKGKKASRRK